MAAQRIRFSWSNLSIGLEKTVQSPDTLETFPIASIKCPARSNLKDSPLTHGLREYSPFQWRGYISGHVCGSCFLIPQEMKKLTDYG